jgi:hypothetical protein
LAATLVATNDARVDPVICFRDNTFARAQGFRCAVPAQPLFVMRASAPGKAGALCCPTGSS